MPSDPLARAVAETLTGLSVLAPDVADQSCDLALILLTASVLLVQLL